VDGTINTNIEGVTNMKVKELIERLKLENPEAIVICQRDPEGNGYSPLDDVDGDSTGILQGYVPVTTWYGERRFCKLTPELRAEGYNELDVCESAEPAIFLVPVN
jgi:hypothetical protein